MYIYIQRFISKKCIGCTPFVSNKLNKKICFAIHPKTIILSVT